MGRGEVFNLTVSEVHEYFANGVLVSNCDAERYIIGALCDPTMWGEEDGGDATVDVIRT